VLKYTILPFALQESQKPPRNSVRKVIISQPCFELATSCKSQPTY